MRAIPVIVLGVVSATAWAVSSTAVGQIVINEVVKEERTAGSGSVSPDTREFVELYNAGGTTVDIGDWSIVGYDYAIAVDTLTTRDMTESFIAEIAKVTDKPVRFIVNTHFHGDHTYTNHLFPGATAICDASTRR